MLNGYKFCLSTIYSVNDMLAPRLKILRLFFYSSLIFMGCYFYLEISTVVHNVLRDVTKRVHNIHVRPSDCVSVLTSRGILSPEIKPFPAITMDDSQYLKDITLRRKKLNTSNCQDFLYSGCHKFTVLDSVWRGAVSKTDVVTFVTQLSSSRFDRLQKVMENWEGPISAAVYVERSNMESFIKMLCNRETFGNRTNVAIHVVIQAGNYYPINFLRNVAQRLTRTPLAFLSDVDFIPGANTQREIEMIYRKDQNFFRESVMIVPAFESLKNEKQIGLPDGKSEVLRMLAKRHIKEARKNKWNPGHMPTKFGKWKTAQEMYEVDYCEKYEPYIVIRTDLSPKYDEHFVERYRDKAQQILEVWAKGMKFFVMPNTFTIHYPHTYERRNEAEAIITCAFSIYEEFRQYVRLKYNINTIKQYKN